MNDYERAAANDIQSRNAEGTNLTDEWYVNGGIGVGLYQAYDFGTIGRPREIGLGAQIVLD